MSKDLTVIGQICQGLTAMEGSLAESLKGTGVTVQRFLATAKTAVQTHQDKNGLEKADRQSLYLAIKKAASDGLMPDGREAALVVYAGKVNYQPMVQGLVKLARNSGEIESIGAYIVHEADKFSYKAGVDDLPQHDADWFGKRGSPVGVWAFVKLKTGEYLDPIMMTKERIDRIATRSKVAGNYNPTTGKDWEEWWKKAAIRNILKYAPKSTALEMALQDDNKEFDLSNEDVILNGPSQPLNPVSDEPKKETRASAVVKKSAAEKEQYGRSDGTTALAEIKKDQSEVIDVEHTEVTESEEVPV